MKKLQIKSLKMKMMILLGCLITITCIGLSINAYLNAKSALLDNMKTTLPNIAEQSASNLEGRIKGTLNALESIAARDNIKDPNVPLSKKMQILTGEVQRRGSLRMSFIDKNGNALDTDGNKSNNADREYFQKALKGESNVSDPILSKTTNKFVVVYAVPIEYNNIVEGVLIEITDGNNLSNLTNKIKCGSSGMAFMVKKDGTLIADTDEQLVLNQYNPINDEKVPQLAEVVKEMTKGETGLGHYEYNGYNKYVGYAPVGNTGWSIGVAIEDHEILAQLSTLKTLTISVSLIFMAIGFIMIHFISNNISKGVKLTSKHLNTLAQGNLSEEVPDKYLDSEDEIGSMTKSMKLMQESLRVMISKIKDNSLNINSQAGNLSSISEEIASVSENVTAAINGIAQETTIQSENLIKITEILNDFGNKLSDMVSEIRIIGENSNDINMMATQSTFKMDEVNKSCDKIGTVSKEFYDKIMNLGRDINKINDMTNIINEIADQTNLLALNASIEAARAGEAGRGFSVVAHEIKKLAEQSKLSASDINKVISNISRDADKIIEGSIEMDEELKGQGQILSETIVAFQNIIKAINEVIPKIDTVKNTAVEIDENKNTIIRKIDELSSITVEVSSSSEEILASAQEMSASTQEVSASAQVLNSKTNEMLDEVNKFKL